MEKSRLSLKTQETALIIFPGVDIDLDFPLKPMGTIFGKSQFQWDRAHLWRRWGILHPFSRGATFQWKSEKE